MPSVLTLRNPLLRKPFQYQDGLHFDFTRNGDAGFHYTKAVGAQPIVGPLASFLTTTRAGTATRINAAGLVEDVAANVARIDYLGPNGLWGAGQLLRESAGTNICLRSEAVGATDWANLGIGAVAGGIDPLPATYPAFFQRLTEDANNSGHRTQITPDPAIVAGETYCFAATFKPGTRRYAALFMTEPTFVNGLEMKFDTWTGRIVQTDIYGVSTLTRAFTLPIGDGCFIAVLIGRIDGVSATGRFLIEMIGDNLLNGYQGDGASYINVSCADVKAGAWHSSYVRTFGAPVTRNADGLAGNLGAWFDNTAVSCALRASLGIAPNTANQFLAEITGGGNNLVWNNALGGSLLRWFASGFGGIGAFAISPNTEFCGAGAIAPGSMGYAANGGNLAVGAPGAVPPALTVFILGSTAGNEVIVGRYKSFHIWPGRFSDTELIQRSLNA
jgi:hypothetical protein